MSDPGWLDQPEKFEDCPEPKWLEACAFHEAQPHGLTDLNEVGMH
jgi:hypothetical protein